MRRWQLAAFVLLLAITLAGVVAGQAQARSKFDYAQDAAVALIYSSDGIDGIDTGAYPIRSRPHGWSRLRVIVWLADDNQCDVTIDFRGPTWFVLGKPLCLLEADGL